VWICNLVMIEYHPDTLRNFVIYYCGQFGFLTVSTASAYVANKDFWKVGSLSFTSQIDLGKI